jgi:hypothetical protein
MTPKSTLHGVVLQKFSGLDEKIRRPNARGRNDDIRAMRIAYAR